MSFPWGDWAIRSIVGNSSTERRTCQAMRKWLSATSYCTTSHPRDLIFKWVSAWNEVGFPGALHLRRVGRLCDMPTLNFLKDEARENVVMKCSVLSVLKQVPRSASTATCSRRTAIPPEGSRQEPSLWSRQIFYFSKSTLLFISAGKLLSLSKPTNQIKNMSATLTVTLQFDNTRDFQFAVQYR